MHYIKHPLTSSVWNVDLSILISFSIRYKIHKSNKVYIREPGKYSNIPVNRFRIIHMLLYTVVNNDLFPNCCDLSSKHIIKIKYTRLETSSKVLLRIWSII